MEIIRKVKEAVSIPVIGNGDVETPQDVIRMMDMTGCDAVMIARGVRGNPWFFQQVNAYLNHQQIIEKPTIEEVIQMIFRHARMAIKYKGEFTAMREMRKHVAWYTHGYPSSTHLRNRVNEVETYDQLANLMSEYQELVQK